MTLVSELAQETPTGEDVRLILVGLLTRTRIESPERFWLQVTVSEALPEPSDATNVIFNGSELHVALADEA